MNRLRIRKKGREVEFDRMNTIDRLFPPTLTGQKEVTETDEVYKILIAKAKRLHGVRCINSDARLEVRLLGIPYVA
jgi:hypothetical protein